MKTFLKNVVMGVVLLAFGGGVWAADSPVSEVYPWLTDLDEARAIAAEQRRPMLIVFRCVP